MISRWSYRQGAGSFGSDHDGFMALHPEMADKYRTSGFEMFWAGIARKCFFAFNK
jgi:hypothetical protein